MNAQCSLELLESALAGNLPPDAETLLARHLETCEACSAALERMAGGPDWCRQAASLLAQDELDAAVPTGESWSEIDFTVEHLEPADEPGVLGRLGGYDVLEVIGRGGMGLVLKGFDRQLKRCVAIKVLAPHLAQSSLARQRFAREAQAAAAVVHPHVLAIHQVQPQGRLPFLVMPLVAGQSLAERLSARGTLELKEILRIGMQAAAGLGAAHEQGLVHRDVKPANILLETGVERAVLTDFGLARAADDIALTRWGVIAGTPEYMAPEQARGEPLDGRSDLFSLGSVMYEMATGVSPFRADSTLATLRHLVDDTPRSLAALNPELPLWFIAVVDRMLQKDPAQRFGSARELSQLLEGCLAHVQQPASVPLPAGLPKSTRRLGRRPSKLVITGVLTMITALATGLIGFFLLSADIPDIAGRWSSEDWGEVVLTKTSGSEYTGTYTDTVGKQPGKLELKWSPVERRFNGSWREGENRFGELSIRLVGEQIHGAYTTDQKSKIKPATPRLADLAWNRADEAGTPTYILATAPSPATAAAEPDEKTSDTDADPPRQPVLQIPIDGPVDVMACSPDGKTLAVANVRSDVDRVMLFDTQTGRQTRAVELLDTEEKSLFITADEPSVVPHGVHVTALAFSPDSSLLAVANNIGQVKLFDAASGAFKLSLDDADQKGADQNPPVVMLKLRLAHAWAKAVAFSPDGSLLATCGSNEFGGPDSTWSRKASNKGPAPLKIWDAKTGELKHDLRAHYNGETTEFTGEVFDVAFSPDGKLLASAERSSARALWDVSDSEILMRHFNNSRAEASVKLWDPVSAKAITFLPVPNESAERGGPLSLSFSPDGKRLAIGAEMCKDSKDGGVGCGSLINVADVATGKVDSISQGWSTRGPIAFSPDGKSVAGFRTDALLMLWDASTGETRETVWSSAPSEIRFWRCFAFIPGTNCVAIAGLVGNGEGVTVWALGGKAAAEAVKAHSEPPLTFPLEAAFEIQTEGAATVVAYSPDGRILAIGGEERVGLYYAITGQLKRALELYDDQEKAILAAPDRVKMWPSPPSVLTFSPDGSLLAVGDIGSVKLFDAASGTLKFALDGVDRKAVGDTFTKRPIAHGYVRAIAFSPDGSLLATCGSAIDYNTDGYLRLGRGPTSGLLKLWDAKTGQLKHDLQGEFNNEVFGVAFSPDGKWLASAGDWDGYFRDKAGESELDPGVGAKIWDPRTAKVVKTLKIPGAHLRGGSVHCLDFSPDGKRLAVGGGDFDISTPDASGGAINVFSLASDEIALSWLVPRAVWQMAFSHDGKSIAALSAEHRLTLFDASTGSPQGHLQFQAFDPKEKEKWLSFAFDPATRRLAISGTHGGRGLVGVWDLDGAADDAR